MTTYNRLYANTPTTAWANGGALAASQSFGPRFASVGSGGNVVGLRWYRVDGSTAPPSTLRLYDRTTGLAVASITSGINSSAGAGWKGTLFAAAFPLVAGRAYTAAGFWTAGSNRSQAASSAWVAPGGTLLRDDNASYVTGGSDTEPTTAVTTVLAPVDIIWNDDGTLADDLATISGGPPTNEDLTAWLSSSASENAHQVNGLPWLLNTELAATKLLAQGALNAFKDVDGNVRSIGDFAKEMTPTLVAIIKLFFNRADTQLTGATSAGGTAFTSLQDRLTDVENQLDGLADLVTARPVTFPGAGWTMADTVDFVQAKSWDVPADLYTLSTSDWPVNIRQTLVDGAPWRPRLGWWAVRNGDLIGRRRFVDWENSYLEDGGRRMPGIVVWLEPNTAGTLEAWRLT